MHSVVPLVCLPKRYGGLGVCDFNIQDIALLLRWWWKLYTEASSLWTAMVTRLYWIGTQMQGPSFGGKEGSFFGANYWQSNHIMIGRLRGM